MNNHIVSTGIKQHKRTYIATATNNYKTRMNESVSESVSVSLFGGVDYGNKE